MPRRTFVFGAALAIVGPALVGIVPATASAQLVDLQQTAQGIRLNLPSGGTEEIDVRTDRILQVSYVAAGTIPTRQSLSVTAHWPAHPAFTIVRNGNSVVVETARLTATVDTNTGLISYAGGDGVPLTAELSKSFGVSPSPAPGAQEQVDTTFSRSPSRPAARLRWSRPLPTSARALSALSRRISICRRAGPHRTTGPLRRRRCAAAKR